MRQLWTAFRPRRYQKQPHSDQMTPAHHPGHRDAAGIHPEPRSFIHAVATRHGIGVFDEHWFEYRQLLFEHLTLASLEAQTSRNFVWLIGIDRAMPERARKRLEHLVQDKPYISLLEVELKADFRAAVAKWVAREASQRDAQWTLTTRVDDDDALHESLFERIQFEAAAVSEGGGAEQAVFTPVVGCNWVPSEGAGHRTFHPSPSMGLSLLLPASDHRSVYDWNHSKLAELFAAKGARIKCIDDRMCWLYTHTNISDQQRIGSNRRTKAFTHSEAFTLSAELLDEFGISRAGAALLREIPEPEPVDTTHYLTSRGKDLEREIASLRQALIKRAYGSESEAAEIRDRIEELHGRRRAMHEHLVIAGPTTADEQERRP
jgi:hypothetical protein